MMENPKPTRLSELTNIDWLKNKYFSDPGQSISLKKGETIMKQGDANQRIYYVEEGKLTGYYNPKQGDPFEIFSAEEHMLVGIYSFFSPEGKSYTSVMAEEDSLVYYVDKTQVPNENHEDYNLFLHYMLPILVNEIYLRQTRAVKGMAEKQSAVRKLYQSEKLATLGQLAAGLSHELNNAIGVIQNKTVLLTEHLSAYFKKNDPNEFSFFEKGVEQGQTLSSKEVRDRKKVLTEKAGFSDKLAKKLAKINLTDTEIEFLAKRRNEEFINKLDHFWETGLALHDLQIASKHTTHVIRSIKDLGAKSPKEVIECDIRLTLKKSLSLLTNLVKKVKVELEVDDSMTIMAREGDLIQIWVNLIKNALESLLNSTTKDPKITILSEITSRHFHIKIIDNGPGIPPKLLPTIFQPNVTTKISGLSFGLGLGLSIVQKIITEYGGTISANSEPRHTEFKVIFRK